MAREREYEFRDEWWLLRQLFIKISCWFSLVVLSWLTLFKVDICWAPSSNPATARSINVTTGRPKVSVNIINSLNRFTIHES
jgi:hypothetical protein